MFSRVWLIINTFLLHMVKWHVKQALFKIPVNGSRNTNIYCHCLVVLRHRSFILCCFWITIADVNTVGKGISIIMKIVDSGPHEGPQTSRVPLTTWELLLWQSAFCGRFWGVLTCLRHQIAHLLEWSASHDPWWGGSLSSCYVGPSQPLKMPPLLWGILRKVNKCPSRRAVNNLCHNTSITVRIGLCRS